MVEKVLQLNREKTLFWTLLGAFFLCAGLHFYFINATVRSTVALQNLETRASQLSLVIGSEEFQYINSRNSITMELASSLGFKETNVKNYISRNPSSNPVAFLSR